jgi:hypothetical protein
VGRHRERSPALHVSSFEWTMELGSIRELAGVWPLEASDGERAGRRGHELPLSFGSTSASTSSASDPLSVVLNKSCGHGAGELRQSPSVCRRGKITLAGARG